MVFSVTPIYALAVAAIYLVLWFRVTALRARKAVSIGDGADPQLLLRIRQHGNCAEWSGFVLILMILAEGMGAPALSLHVVGALLVLGRMVHPIGLKIDTASHALRYLGNGSNIAASLVAMASLGIRLANA